MGRVLRALPTDELKGERVVFPEQSPASIEKFGALRKGDRAEIDERNVKRGTHDSAGPLRCCQILASEQVVEIVLG